MCENGSLDSMLAGMAWRLNEIKFNSFMMSYIVTYCRLDFDIAGQQQTIIITTKNRVPFMCFGFCWNCLDNNSVNGDLRMQIHKLTYNFSY